MAEANDTAGMVYSNLADTGSGGRMAEKYMRMRKEEIKNASHALMV